MKQGESNQLWSVCLIIHFNNNLYFVNSPEDSSNCEWLNYYYCIINETVVQNYILNNNVTPLRL